MRWYLLLIFFIAVVAYLFIGAAVFQALESDKEQDTKTISRDRLKQFLSNNTCVDVKELEALVRSIIASYDEGVLITNQTESADNWNLWSSFFFSATVITTIGYGHISPSTASGRLFCIFYALIGIPLTGVFLTGLGQNLSKPLTIFRNKSQNKCIKILKTVVIGILGFAILIFLPALGFHRLEDWSMFEGIYYAVITLTTVGFGDYVAAQDTLDGRSWYQVVTIVWIFIGLSWVAIILSDVGDFFSKTAEKNTQRIKRHKSNKEFDAVRTPKGPRSVDFSVHH